MEERVLTGARARAGAGRRGFTLVEVLTAMLIGVVVLTANLTLFNFAQKDFAFSRSLTDATNLATATLADFKTMTVNQINLTTAVPTAAEKTADLARKPPLGLGGPLVVGWHEETPGHAAAPGKGDCTRIGGRVFCRSWCVSNVDVEPDGTADMVGDIVKVKLVVDWWVGAKRHTVTLATLTTGKPL